MNLMEPSAKPPGPRNLGVCAKVWGALDKLDAKLGDGVHPQLSDILKVANRRKLNPTTARVQFYQWRKAHGISGRQA